MKKMLYILFFFVYTSLFCFSPVFADECIPGTSWTQTWADAFNQTTYTLEGPCKAYIGIPFNITATVTDNAYPNSLVGSGSIKDNGAYIWGVNNWIRTVSGQWQQVIPQTYTGDPISHQIEFQIIDFGQGGGAHQWGYTLTGHIVVDPFPPAPWADNKDLHNSNRFGTCSIKAYSGTSQAVCEANGGAWSPTSKWNGSWGVPGGQYGAIDCSTCHTSHKTNIKKIKEQITAPDNTAFPGSQVVFQSTTAPDGFGDDSNLHVTSQKVCEVCHSQNKYHNYNTANNSRGTDHNNSTDCMECHEHSRAFAVSCTKCHGFPPVDNATMVAIPAPTGSQTAGVHATHVDAADLDCTVCHYNSKGTGSTHNDKTIQAITLGFYLFNGAIQGGAYDGQTGVDYNTTVTTPATIVSNSGAKTCSSIYCHGSTMAPNGGTNTTPVWDNPSTGACGACHGASAENPPTRGSHQKHVAATKMTPPACNTCHADTQGHYEPAHVNNKSEVSFSADVRVTGGAYSGNDTMLDPYGSCTNIYCHSNGNPAPNTDPTKNEPNEYKTVTWGGASMGCDSCHRGKTTDTLTMRSNGHDRLVGKDWIRKYPCEYCHAATTDLAGNIIDLTKHLNGTRDVSISSRWYIDNGTAPSYDPNTMVCSNVYCHSDGTVNPDQVRPFAWTGVRKNCNICHGHVQGTCSSSGCHDGTTHIDGKFWEVKADWPAGEQWKEAMPMFANQGPGAPRANSHMKHLQDNYTCDNCHALTIVNGSCTDCHGILQGTMSEVAHINGAYHVNKQRDVFFKAGGNYNESSKTCVTTYCHGTTTPQWGGASLLCNACHNANNTLQGRHSVHYASPTSAINRNAANNSTTSAYIFTCGVCHDSGSTHHANGAVSPFQAAEVVFNTSIAGGGTYIAGASVAGTDTGGRNWTAGTCTSTYCHSNATGGTFNSGDTRGIAANTSPAWDSSATCGSCHGEGGSSGRPSYSNGSLKANSHSSHGYMTCEKCHWLTTQTGNTISDRTKHVNGLYDLGNSTGTISYSFNVAGGSCSGTFGCHGNATWGNSMTLDFSNCISCHKTSMGSRRQIVDSNGNGTGTGGDFKKTSHHHYPSSGTITNADCLVCHETSQHPGGSVRLKDADTGAVYVYDPANPSTAENFCLSCHDSNGANGNMSPFSDGKTLGVIPYKAGKDIKDNWNKTFGHKQKGLTCLGNGNANTGCHSSGHGSDYKGLLAKNLTLPNLSTSEYTDAAAGSYDICFNCHQNYPRVTKEAILGYRSGGHYDVWGDGSPPYNIPNILTNFRDRYDGSAKSYDDGGDFTWYSNLHYFHIQAGGWAYRGTQSSSINCISCHNVHGSNTQSGWLYDEMQYKHYTEGSDQYGTMDMPNYGLLNSYPTNCTFNCHSIQGKTHNWFEPSNE